MSEFKIAHRMIGDNHPPVVIAEIGINHGLYRNSYSYG